LGGRDPKSAFELTTSEKDGRAFAPQAVGVKSGGVARQNHQRNEHVFAKPVQPFADRPRREGGKPLEAESLDDTHHCLVVCCRTETYIGADSGHIVELGSRCEIGGELAQRKIECMSHTPRPTQRRTVSREEWNLLVPEMQIDEALAWTHTGAVNEDQFIVAGAEFYAEYTVRRVCIFDHAVVVSQTIVDGREKSRQPWVIGPSCFRGVESWGACLHRTVLSRRVKNK
jgi:hypothetical protein